ncbi:MAG: hypothetical protein EOO07_11185 [Chitinophagaceae bacterium]|nr:MAG: hypothetical protein EOO07_11185 [Chitinophagaceae bacterium]
MKKLLGIALVLLTSMAFGQKDKALRDTLLKRRIWDQKAAGLPPTGIEFTSSYWKNFKDSVFLSHYHFLQKTFKKTGFPGNDLVGEDGANSFWLMTQHCDKWPDFQKKVLVSMKKQVDKKNASAVDYAYLTDRVALNTGGQQLYGTQVTYDQDSCMAKPKALKDPANVNARRKRIGMDVIEKYLNSMSEMHFLMNQAIYEKKGIKGPKLYVIPE